MKKKSSNKMISLFFIVYFIFICIFALHIYLSKKNEIIKNIKLKLKNATQMAYVIVGNVFLVNAMENPELNSKKIIWEKISKLTKYNFIHNITSTGFEGLKNNQVYDLVVALEKKSYLTHHIEKVTGDSAYNFNLSKNNPIPAKGRAGIIKSSKKIVYVWKKGSTGIEFLICFNHIKLSNDKIVVSIAGIYLKNINEITNTTTFFALLWLSFFILFGILIAVVIRKKLKQEKEELETAKKDIEDLLNKAQKANNSKDQFFANMSHDFRTPLNAIIGFSRQIINNGGDPEIGMLGRYIKMSSEYMLHFTEDLLDFAKLEMDSLTYIEEVVNLKDIYYLINSCFVLKAYQEEKVLHIRMAPDLPMAIVSSKRRLFQILNNLILNSMKFTKKGDTIDVHINKTSDNKLEIIVKDTGIGIDKKELENIFKKFYKLNIKNTGSGTGLGLYITNTLVGSMGGTVVVDSVKGKYTEFKVLLPLVTIDKDFSFEDIYEKFLERSVDEEEDFRDKMLKIYIDENVERIRNVKKCLAKKDNKMIRSLGHTIKGSSADNKIYEIQYYAEKIQFDAEKENPNYEMIKKYQSIMLEIIEKLPYPNIKNLAQEPEAIKDKKILIVDDDRNNRLLLQKTLSNIGIGADIAPSGKEAIEKVKSKKGDGYKIIFLDIHMPDMNGKEVLKKLKELKVKSEIFAFTADISEKTEKELVKLGFDDVVEKPLMENVLYSIVKKI